MVSEERVQAVLVSSDSLSSAAQGLIDEANAAGGRDNITVVLFRVEEVEGGKDGVVDQPTMVGAPAVAASSRAGGAEPTVSEPASPAAASTAERAPRMRPGRHSGEAAGAHGVLRRRLKFRKPVAVLIAVVIVLALIIGGGYLATRNLYFIGTNANGIVTIYRGLPYDLPAGIHLYETFYVSGVPAALVPPDRRSALFNNNLRSESDAAGLVRALELGQVSK
jgi:protein phosphatase